MCMYVCMNDIHIYDIINIIDYILFAHYFIILLFLKIFSLLKCNMVLPDRIWSSNRILLVYCIIVILYHSWIGDRSEARSSLFFAFLLFQQLPAALPLFITFFILLTLTLYCPIYYTCIILISLPAEKKHSIPKKIRKEGEKGQRKKMKNKKSIALEQRAIA